MELERLCEKVEGLTSSLEGAVATTATWRTERERLEQGSLASQRRIIELEQALDAERRDCAAAQLEIKRWVIAAADAEIDAAADAEDDDDDVSAWQDPFASTASGSKICEGAAPQAPETQPATATLRPQLSVTFVREGALGMNLTGCRDDNGVMLLAVQPNTQAAEDHSTVLRTGLVISEVAGQSVEGLSYQEVTQVIAGHPSRPLTVKFWADGDDEDGANAPRVPGLTVRSSASAYE